MASPTRRGRPRTAIDPARQAAFDALSLVQADDAYLNLALPQLMAERQLDSRDAALATELANGTARMLGSYDAIIAACVDGGPDALQPPVLTALRLGSHQLLSMRVPAHAAVGTSVELTRQAVGERPVRLVNAVLRRIAARPLDDWLAQVAPDRDTDLIGHLAVVHSHPRWIVAAFQNALGGDVDELEALLAADNAAPAVTLAVRPGLASVDELASNGAAPGRWSPYAAVLRGGDPGGLSQIRAGTVGVQDEGSQLAALLVTRAAVDGSDTRWLDVCAGPGGKAALLTGLGRRQGAVVIAADRQPHRARLVQAGLRAYPGPAPVLVADGTRPPWLPATFDRVIIDAPCTGLGALRRRPESRWRRLPGDIDALVPLQTDLLLTALDSVRPSGVVAYVTCSPHAAETRGVVDDALRRRTDVHEEDSRLLLPELPDVGDGPHVQLWPHRHGTDAMFMAMLRRR